MREYKVRASSMSGREKILAIQQQTGWNQKEVALKVGRDPSAITRILQGHQPKTASLQARIDDLFEEVVTLHLWDRAS